MNKKTQDFQNYIMNFCEKHRHIEISRAIYFYFYLFIIGEKSTKFQFYLLKLNSVLFSSQFTQELY